MELKEKVAYIKGMMEGMEFDTATKEGKLLAAVVDVLEEMAKEVTNIDEDVDTLYDEVDAMSEDLEDVENFLFDEDGGDEDEDDYDEEYEAGLYEITCPQCGEVVCVDEDMLANDDLACPNCGTKFEVDFSEDDDACEGCEGCCGGKDEEYAGKAPLRAAQRGFSVLWACRGRRKREKARPCFLRPFFTGPRVCGSTRHKGRPE